MIFDRLQIFISSSMEELEPERAAVKLALTELELDAWVFEQDAGARTESPQATFSAELEKSDLFVGLYWTKLGAYSLEEYQRAVELQKDVLLYEKRDRRLTRSPELQRFLDSAGDVTVGRTIHRFDDSEDLKQHVKEHVAAWQAAKVRKQIAALRAPSVVGERESEWRASLLYKVDQFWLENVLDRSLNRESRLDISTESEDESVEHPWEQIVLLPDRRPRSSQKPIQDIFAECQRLLLILGAPGAGKTTTLLELARYLVQRAKNDQREPVPVVLNLASWHGGRLFAWIESELGLRYQIPKRVGRKLVGEHQILLLLDGLDEVRAAERHSCVREINRFLEEHGAPGLTVSCREEEYQQLRPARLRLGGAVRLKPLEFSQINDHLERAGPPLAGLRTALNSDSLLRELAQTPLLLDMMRIAYRDLPPDALAGSTPRSLAQTRRKLMDSYVDRMFERRGRTGPYSRDVTLAHVSKLARKLTDNGEVVFQVETLQPLWLDRSRVRRLYVLFTRSMSAVPLGLLSPDSLVLAFLFWAAAGLGVGLMDLRRLSRPSVSLTKRGTWSILKRILTTGGVAVAGGFVLSGLYLLSWFAALVYQQPALRPVASTAAILSLLWAVLYSPVFQIIRIEQLYQLPKYVYEPLLVVTAIVIVSLPFTARTSFWNPFVDVRRAEGATFRWRRFASVLLAIVAILMLFQPWTKYERGEHVRLGDGRTGAITAVLHRTEDVERFGFCPDGSIAWAGDRPVSIWRTKDGSLLNTQDTGWDPQFSPDCKRYVLAGYGSSVGVWHVDNGLIGIVHPSASNDVSWSEDSRKLYVTQLRKIVVYDAADLRVVRTFEDPASTWEEDFAVSRNKKYAVELSRRNRGRVWDIETGRLLSLSPSIAIGPQDFTDESETVPLTGSHVSLDAFNFLRYNRPAPPHAPKECQGSSLLSPDHRVAITDNTPMCLCETETGRVLGAIAIDPEFRQFGSVHWSPDSTRVVVDYSDGLWDARSGARIASLPKLSHFVFSADSARLAGAGAGRVVLWDARDGRFIKTLVTTSGAILFGPAGEQFLIEAQPSDYGRNAAIIIVFGSIIGLLLSFRATPDAASVRRTRALRLLTSRAARAGLVVGLVALAAGVFTTRQPTRLFELFAMGFGLTAWFCGGMDLFHHFLLRSLMVWEKVMPWRWEPLLNFAVDLALMRKVGTGYIFIHPLLLEHFADSVASPRSKGRNSGTPEVDRKTAGERQDGR